MWGKVENLRRSAAERLAPFSSAMAAKAHALGPAFSQRVAEAGQVARAQIRGVAPHATAFFAWPRAALSGAGNALSLPHRVGRFDLSQVLIIAGAFLLICGALMLGSGVFLRADKPSAVVAATPSEPIAWLFEHDTLALDERSVFAYAATPDGMRIKAFAIGGVNTSDHTLNSVTSVIRPDRQAKDLGLALRVNLPDEQDGDAKIFAPGEPATLPAHAQFRLFFLIPGDGGMTPDQVRSAFGGIVLKLHYEAEGTKKSLIHYLSPSFLDGQLAEIMAEVKGS
jgi:hypothetical protein